MAQPAAPTRPSPRSVGATPPDTGIEFRSTQSGSGKGARSRGASASSGNTSGGKSSFFGVFDPKAFEAGLGRASSANNILHRNALATELSRPEGPDLALVKSHLQAIVAENRARNGNKTPDGLHLYMGFGDVPPQEGLAASTKAHDLSQSIDALRGQLGDNECEQMLQWLSHDWKAYEDIHAPKVVVGGRDGQGKAYRQPTRKRLPTIPERHEETGNKKNENQIDRKAVTTRTTTNTITTTTTTTTTAIDTTAGPSGHLPSRYAQAKAAEKAQVRPEVEKARKDLADPLEILNRAAIRDLLFRTLEARDVPGVTAILKKLPPISSYHAYFPEPSPLIGISEAAIALADHPDWAALHNYVRHVRVVATYQLTALTVLPRDPRAREQYPVAVQAVCHALAIPEDKLVSQKAGLKGLIKKAMKEPQLAARLAEQPFASLKLLIQRITLLMQHVESKDVVRFRDILVQARALQGNHGKLLRDAILKTPQNPAELEPLIRINYAAMTTAGTGDYLSIHSSEAQVEALHGAIHKLYDDAVKNSGGKNHWEITVLKLLRNRIDRTYKAQSSNV